jgi:hypothetical protein
MNSNQDGSNMRRTFALCLGIVAYVFTGSAATADDKTDCMNGIAMIQAELAKQPPAATLSKLQAALRSAERELKEAEYDECFDAIEDAQKALRR